MLVKIHRTERRNSAFSIIDVSESELNVMKVLCGKTMYGIEICEKSNGKVKRGSIFAATKSLEVKSLISSTTEKLTRGRRSIPKVFHKALFDYVEEVPNNEFVVFEQ